METQKNYHQPKRTPVSHELAVKLWDQLIAESHEYSDQDQVARTEWWSNSTSVKGVRRLHITFYQPSGYMRNKPVHTVVQEMWLSDMQEIIANWNLQDYVKVSCFQGVWYIYLWYRSDGRTFKPRRVWDTHPYYWFVGKFAHPEHSTHYVGSTHVGSTVPVLWNPEDIVVSKLYKQHGRAVSFMNTLLSS